MERFNFKIKKDISKNWLINTDVTKKELTFGISYKGNVHSLYMISDIEIFDKSIISYLKHTINSDARDVKDVRYVVSLISKLNNYEQRHIISNLKITKMNDHIILR